MKDKDPIACGLFVTPVDHTGFNLSAFSNLEGNVSEEEADHYEALIEGIGYMIRSNPFFFVDLGNMILDQSEMEIEFEPADELEQAIAEAKIIPFNKKN
jgi:hypothetical protein